ncbi:MAG: Vitamin B12 dependent methionine synthase activation subunit [Clostridiales bacterium]|nr:Vitamin B12 dependent methionine synthase activation subunit [Clostridiales bacterium]
MPLGVAISESEVRRYMGFRGPVDPSTETDAMIAKAIKNLEKDCNPKYVSKAFSVTVDGFSVKFADVTVESRALARNLAGCTECVLFAATAGPSCDMLVKRAAVTSSAYASCCQAAGAAAIEAYCDLINDKIKDEYEAKGLYARPRFSPGYGDLSLSHQKDWFRLLDVTKITGIELTDSLLMVPTKSVTAIIGLSPNKLPCVKQGCEACTMSQTCAFSRKE